MSDCEVFSISNHVNNQLRTFALNNLPDWAASDKVKRVIRYANSYAKNAKLIHLLNNSPRYTAQSNTEIDRELQ